MVVHPEADATRWLVPAAPCLASRHHAARLDVPVADKSANVETQQMLALAARRWRTPLNGVMAWIFASVVLVLVVTVPGVWRKVGIMLLALVIAFSIAACSWVAGNVM
jgi:hypothetical protein